MIKKGILMGIGLYLALILVSVVFNACGKSGSDSLSSLLLLGGKSSYFVTIPEGAAY
jgi:hypothetical protein